MSKELSILEQSANSLALMLMGLDHTLDLKLKEFRSILKAEELNDDDLSQALSAAEVIYDDLELSINTNLQSFGNSFQALLHASSKERREKLIGPLLTKEAVINDLITLAEPISNELSRLLDASESPVIDSPEIDAVRERLGSRFLSLIEALTLLGDDDGALLELSKTLTPTPDWNTLDRLASKIITLLQDRVSAEKEQFEVYLAQLNLKLKRINDIVESDSKTLDEIKQINIDFNSTINQQMIDARHKIDNHSELKLLKSDLLQSLDAITSRLEAYQHSYSDKLLNLHESKTEMNGHIQSLEKENLALLKELTKERKMSLIDPLTQLPNRLGFERRLAEELTRAERYNQPISIAILDIDFFKRINDDFGHLVGDKVLKIMAKEMKEVSRGSDFLARFGGEEFILLLPQTNLEDAYIAVDKIRQRIESRPFHFQNKPVPITISGGVSEKLADEETSAWIHRADLALYESKENGRNKVSSAA
ncbi:GGDEF domain-containing protein [Reinekea sp.]|jgi:diguanylate cyclase|uniref:sensor domain-containing diguanylate cyclase n=1 Tax=Reinekea sp. TaxID=1970455 RepID=UPI00398A16EB